MALGPATIPAHGAFLIVLFILACLALTFRKNIERLIRDRRALWSALAMSGALGGALALQALSVTGAAHVALVWLSAPLVSCGFLASFLAWGLTISDRFSTTQLVVLSASYLVSLAVFRPSVGIPIAACPLIVPLGSGLLWLLSAPPRSVANAPQAGSAERKPSANPSILLFAAFLLAGSVVRGIMDATVVSVVRGIMDATVVYGGNRRALSLPITALLVTACIVYGVVMRRRHRTADPLLFVLGCWIGFATLFFCGVFAFLVVDGLSVGGSLVVIARSMLEVVLWMFLCDCAHRRNVPAVPLFIVGGVFVEIASWAISYVAIPALAPTGDGGPQMLTLIAIFGLIAVITTICGVLLVLQNTRRESDGAKPPETVAPKADGNQEMARLLESARGLTAREATVAMLYSRGYSLSKVAEELGVSTSSAQTSIKNAYRKLDARGLTAREATVAMLYSRGYSLSKVAEELGVSTSSAQTSIKNAYRKLDVHSKDELIAAVEELREG